MIHEDEIARRAQSNARSAALRELQQEQQAREQAEAQGRAANVQQAQASLAQLAQRWRAELAPLYARRADAHGRGDLDDAFACEQQMRAIHDEGEAAIDWASRLLQQRPDEVVQQLRRDAGVPARHDSLSECPGLSDVQRVVARGMAMGLIGPRGLDHPSGTGFIEL